MEQNPIEEICNISFTVNHAQFLEYNLLLNSKSIMLHNS